MNDPQPLSGPLRPILLVLGWFFVGLGAIGVVLPVLPTTPLLILAAACFWRSSPRFYRWVVGNRVFGPLIESWRSTHTIPVRAKATAITLIVLVGGSSVFFFLTRAWAKVLLGATLLTLILWILSVPSRASAAAPHRDGERQEREPRDT